MGKVTGGKVTFTAVWVVLTTAIVTISLIAYAVFITIVINMGVLLNLWTQGQK